MDVRTDASTNFETLFPLGKKSQDPGDWPDHYESLFGFRRDMINIYKEAARLKRFPKIRSRWSECKPQATVCFGSWEEFRRLFDLGPRAADDRICPYEELRILLVPFMTGRWGLMNNSRVDSIAGYLKRWAVQLP